MGQYVDVIRRIVGPGDMWPKLIKSNSVKVNGISWTSQQNKCEHLGRLFQAWFMINSRI